MRFPMFLCVCVLAHLAVDIWLSTIGEPQELNQIFSFIGALLAHWSSVRKLAQASEGRLQPSNDQHKAGRQVRLRKKVS